MENRDSMRLAETLNRALAPISKSLLDAKNDDARAVAYRDALNVVLEEWKRIGVKAEYLSLLLGPISIFENRINGWQNPAMEVPNLNRRANPVEVNTRLAFTSAVISVFTSTKAPRRMPEKAVANLIGKHFAKSKFPFPKLRSGSASGRYAGYTKQGKYLASVRVDLLKQKRLLAAGKLPTSKGLPDVIPVYDSLLQVLQTEYEKYLNACPKEPMEKILDELLVRTYIPM